MLAGKVSGHLTTSPSRSPPTKSPQRIELSIYKTIGKNFHEHEFSLNCHFIIFFKQMTGGCQTAQGSSTLIDRSLTVNFKFEEAWQESKILGKQSG